MYFMDLSLSLLLFPLAVFTVFAGIMFEYSIHMEHGDYDEFRDAYAMGKVTANIDNSQNLILHKVVVDPLGYSNDDFDTIFDCES